MSRSAYIIPPHTFVPVRAATTVCYSTHAYAADQPLALTRDSLFAVPLGQSGQGFPRALTETETNLRPWTVGWSVGDVVVELFGVGGHSLREFGDELERNLSLRWDFMHVLTDMGPVGAFPYLWHPEGRYAGRILSYEKRCRVNLPARSTWGIRAFWGPETPVSPFPFRLRVTLTGEVYENLGA